MKFLTSYQAFKCKLYLPKGLIKKVATQGHSNLYNFFKGTYYPSLSAAKIPPIKPEKIKM